MVRRKRVPNLGAKRGLLARVCWLGLLALGCGRGKADEALELYEVLRAALVQQGAERVSPRAEELAKLATLASDGLPEKRRFHLEALAGAARELGTAQGVDAIRQNFGEVSRHLVAFVQSDPELQKQYQLLECKTAPGYAKWLQPSQSAIGNPYQTPTAPPCATPAPWGGSSCPFDLL